MARHLIARSPFELAGSLVLDAGAGTGAASAALGAAHARVVAVDFESTMLEFDSARRPSGVIGDITSLPLRTGVFDAVVAAFVLNHIAPVPKGLRELARVTRPGGAVLASTFSNRRARPRLRLTGSRRRSDGLHPRGTTRSGLANHASARSIYC